MQRSYSSEMRLGSRELLSLIKLCFPVVVIAVLGLLGIYSTQSLSFELPGNLNPLAVSVTPLLVLTLTSIYFAWKYIYSSLRLINQEQGLRRNSVLLEGFFENNPSIMWVKNIEGGYNLVNQSFRQFSRTTDIPVESIEHSKIFGLQNSSVMEDQDKQVLKFRSPMEFEAVWEDSGIRKHYSILRFPLINEHEEVFAIGGIAHDRTDQVNARRALRESERQFRSLVESAADAILIADNNGNILLANKQAEKIFIMTRSELLKSNLKSLLPEIDYEKFPQANSKCVELSTDEAVENNLMSTSALNSEGNKVDVEAAISVSESESGTTNTCIVRDVSDRVRLEAQLRESQKMDAIGKLTGGMAHDFNNLLGIVMGNIDLAIRKVEKDSPLLKRLEIAKKAGARGAELTQRMLAVARRQPLTPKPNSIKEIVEDMGDMLPRTLGPEIKMHYDIQDGLPNVLVDRSGLENVVLNLAINSSHAMPDGGQFVISSELVELTSENAIIVNESMAPGNYVQLSITDTGAGMNEKTLSRAFEPFFSTKERTKGTGLGLAMVYGFAKQSGGSVKIFSEVGQGTTINIFLPAAEEAAGEEPMITDLEKSGKSKTSGKVLVVDDEIDLLEVTSSFVEDIGFDVISATNGTLALEILEENPDIEYLLTDIVMPGGINGVSLAEKVKVKIPNIKVLYMSGFPSGVIADKSGIELDGSLLTKPFSYDDLVTAMADLGREAA